MAIMNRAARLNALAQGQAQNQSAVAPQSLAQPYQPQNVSGPNALAQGSPVQGGLQRDQALRILALNRLAAQGQGSDPGTSDTAFERALQAFHEHFSKRRMTQQS